MDNVRLKIFCQMDLFGLIYDKNFNAFIKRIDYGASLLRVEQNSIK